MSATFASQEWADSFAVHLRDDAQVRTESVTWIFGPLLLQVEPDAELGFEGAVLRLDLFEGDLRSITLVTPAEAERSPFVLTGSFARWKTIFGGQLAIIDAVLQSRLVVRGDLPTLTRHRALLDAITRVAASLDTVWHDEQVEATTAG
jgi:hypothetical protein